MQLNTTLPQVIDSDLLTYDAKEWAINNWHYLTNVNTPLINVNSSAKIVKGKKLNIFTGILYLKPADSIATNTICAAAELAGCKAGCLESSGQLGMKTGDNAKIKRTICYLLESKRFEREVKREILKHHLKYGDSLAIRLNGTSDIDFSSLIASMPQVQFYDYTKIYYHVKNNNLTNYDLTYSGSANNERTIKQTARAIKAGKRVVIALNTAETKNEWKRPTRLGDIPLIDMDQTDVRFKDATNSVGTLKRKGSNKNERERDNSINNFFFNAQTIDKLKTLLA